MTTIDADGRLKFGIFLAPFHPVGQNPTLALERDLQLIEHLDALGFDEAWFGEHHSAGYEIIASPEVFIAAAAQRTKHIRLGTGVSSLPYHHPFMLADRMVLLDHLTRGRVMFGVGPGALPSDAFMMGIDPAKQRDMMEESLEAILLLLAGETVTMETDWFKLVKARLQLRPYQRPFPEVAVAAQVSPAGPRAAGRFGTSLLSIGATSAGGFDVLGIHWDVMEERAAEFSTTVDRNKWRLVGPMHIADTKEQAVADVAFGLEEWVDYFQRVAALPAGAQHRELRVARRRAQRVGLRRHRHGGGRHRAGGPAAGAVQGLRHLPPHGPRVGRHRRHPSLLRADRPLRGAALPGLGGVADREPGLGGGEPPRVHRRRRQRRHVGHSEAPRGEGRQGGRAARRGRRDGTR